MRRQRIELEDIAAWNNLQLAVFKAVKGKRQRPDIVRFLANLDQCLAQLRFDILAENVPYGHYRAFVIHDPKRRSIHAADFKDRVLHHAVMNLAEGVFEKSLVATTYACRPGKGVHRAVAQVQKNLQRFPWYVQVDVDGYFPSIDHRRLLDLLARRFKGDAFLRLLDRIVASFCALPGKGLPIGSLTSQHFANLYLDGADRFLLRQAVVQAHVRYMDDIVWWCPDKHSALQILAEFRGYLFDECKLVLKPEARINRSSHGLTYCGSRIAPGCIRLTQRKQRRYRLLRQRYEKAWHSGIISDRVLQSGYDAVLAATLPALSCAWRQHDLQKHPSLYDNDGG